MRPITIVVRLAVALTIVAVLALTLDLNKIAHVVSRIDGLTVTVASLLMLAGIPIAAWRWHLMLEHAGANVPLLEAVRITLISQVTALGLPSAHGGDVVRGLMLKSSSRTSIDRVLASLFADRIYGTLSIGLLALPGIVAIASLREDTGFMWPTLVFCLGAFIAVPLMHVLIPPLERFARPQIQGAPAVGWLKIRTATADTLRGLQFAFADVRTVAVAIALSLVVHGLAVLSAWLLGHAIGITAPDWAYLVFVPAVWIITMLPLSLGGVGVREVSFALLFQTVGVPFEQGTALGALVSVTSILGTLAGGAVFLIFPGGGRVSGG